MSAYDANVAMSKLLKRMLLVCLLAGGGLLMSSAPAHARGSVPRGVELELPHLAFHNYGLGGAIGGRVSFALNRGGIIRNFPDRLALSIGLDAYYTKYGPKYGGAIGVPIVLHWGMYFTQVFSIYFELGVNAWFHEGSFAEPPEFAVFFPSWIMGAFGMKFHITDRLAINLRLGAPYSSLGLSFML